MPTHSHHSHAHNHDGPRNIWVEDTLWVESRADGDLQICFGQFGKLKESSPGHLGDLPLLTAWIGESTKPNRLTITPQSDALRITGATARNHVQAEDSSVSVVHATGAAGRKPVLCARWWPAGSTDVQDPRLTLDMVLTGTKHTFRIFFRGVALPGALVEVFSNNGERLAELTSDASGEFVFAANDSGLHQCICSHTENLPVCVGGHLYAGTRYWSTLTWHAPL